jgi:hypothetical protein
VGKLIIDCTGHGATLACVSCPVFPLRPFVTFFTGFLAFLTFFFLLATLTGSRSQNSSSQFGVEFVFPFMWTIELAIVRCYQYMGHRQEIFLLSWIGRVLDAQITEQ